MLNSEIAAVHWREMFVPSGSLLELVVRGSVMYLLILTAFRLFRRDAGTLAVSDLIVVVLVADAAQNGMAGEYRSITEGVVLVATIFAWDYSLDWLAYRSPLVRRLLQPPPLELIRDGRVQRRNLRAEMITLDDLRQQLREHGVDDLTRVKRCCLEGDGQVSVITYDGKDGRSHRRDRGAN